MCLYVMDGGKTFVTCCTRVHPNFEGKAYSTRLSAFAEEQLLKSQVLEAPTRCLYTARWNEAHQLRIQNKPQRYQVLLRRVSCATHKEENADHVSISFWWCLPVCVCVCGGGGGGGGERKKKKKNYLHKQN